MLSSLKQKKFSKTLLAKFQRRELRLEVGGHNKILKLPDLFGRSTTINGISQS